MNDQATPKSTATSENILSVYSDNPSALTIVHELRQVLERTYSHSPEGRAYLARMDKVIRENRPSLSETAKAVCDAARKLLFCPEVGSYFRGPSADEVMRDFDRAVCAHFRTDIKVPVAVEWSEAEMLAVIKDPEEKTEPRTEMTPETARQHPALRLLASKYFRGPEAFWEQIDEALKLSAEHARSGRLSSLRRSHEANYGRTP